MIRSPSHRDVLLSSIAAIALAWPGAAWGSSRIESNRVADVARARVGDSVAAARTDDIDVGTEVWALLLPPLRGAPPDVDAIATKVVRLGSPAVGAIVRILTGELPEPDVEYEVHPKAIERRTDILTACLRRMPRGEVLNELAARATPRSSTDLRLLVVRWLSQLGGADALDRVLVVAASLEPIQYQRAFVVAPIEQGLLSFLTEDPAHVRAIGKALDRGPDALAPILARVVAASRAPASSTILLRNMGRTPELDLEIVRGLGTCGTFADADVDGGGLERIRGELDSADGELQRAAITTLARLGDADSARTFVALLAHPDPLTVVAAKHALESLSGTRNEADAAAWTEWLESEFTWLESRLPELVEVLSATDAGRVSTALSEIQRHPLHRHAIAAAWRPQLASTDAARRALFARLFGSLGSARAVPWLVALLDDPDLLVRRAAGASLVQLTGLDLPAEAARWKVLLSS